MTENPFTVSLGEVRFYLTRAAVGVSAPFGIAEDFANAVQWTARLGIDPAPLALSSLMLLDQQPDRSDITVAEYSTDIVFSGHDNLSALYAGPALVDFSHLRQEGSVTLTARQVDHPVLVAAALAAADVGACLIEWPDARIILTKDGGTTVEATSQEVLLDVGPADVAVCGSHVSEPAPWSPGYRLGTADLSAAVHRIHRQGLTVDTGAWRSIVTLFERCLVPSSEQSLVAGAGAGLVDTD